MKKALMTTVFAFSTIVGGAIVTPTSNMDVQAKPKKTSIYKDCKTFNKKYPKGVRYSKATKNIVKKRDGSLTQKPSNAKVSASIYKKAYKMNRNLDRDRDGIACEK